jgi:hypothetical protein
MLERSIHFGRSRRHRHAEQGALCLVAVQQLEQVRLLLRLDAIRRDPQLERVPECDDRRDDRKVLRIVGHAHDERAIELQ